MYACMYVCMYSYEHQSLICSSIEYQYQGMKIWQVQTCAMWRYPKTNFTSLSYTKRSSGSPSIRVYSVRTGHVTLSLGHSYLYPVEPILEPFHLQEKTELHFVSIIFLLIFPIFSSMTSLKTRFLVTRKTLPCDWNDKFSHRNIIQKFWLSYIGL